jgi:hypothetical protein
VLSDVAALPMQERRSPTDYLRDKQLIDYNQLAFPKGRIRLKGEPLMMLRLACLQRDRGRCRECHVRVSDSLPDWHPLKYDMAHIKSRGAGGSDTLENVRTLCHQCHTKEHNGNR